MSLGTTIATVLRRMSDSNSRPYLTFSLCLSLHFSLIVVVVVLVVIVVIVVVGNVVVVVVTVVAVLVSAGH